MSGGGLSPTGDGSKEPAKWLVIQSRVLNEIILMVFDTADLAAAEAAHPGKVIYFPQEVRELQGQRTDPEFTRNIHLVKKKLGGWIVPSDSPCGKQMRRWPSWKGRDARKRAREKERQRARGSATSENHTNPHGTSASPTKENSDATTD
jgi:hypothetical protein